METSAEHEKDRWDPEPRWPALIAVIAVGGLYFALPGYLIIGPRWRLPAVVIARRIPTVITHRAGKHHLNRILGFTVTGLVTVGMIVSVILLIAALPAHRESPTELLLSAASLWTTNILAFALWYWRLDAGGPHGRDSRLGRPDGAFLFPQMTMFHEEKINAGQQNWSPNFVDYLFLAFNTSLAFSSIDVPVLARWVMV